MSSYLLLIMRRIIFTMLFNFKFCSLYLYNYKGIQECVSEFISFITSEASDKCQNEKRKTINGDDILWAMTTLGTTLSNIYLY